MTPGAKASAALLGASCVGMFACLWVWAFHAAAVSTIEASAISCYIGILGGLTCLYITSPG